MIELILLSPAAVGTSGTPRDELTYRDDFLQPTSIDMHTISFKLSLNACLKSSSTTCVSDLMCRTFLDHVMLNMSVCLSVSSRNKQVVHSARHPRSRSQLVCNPFFSSTLPSTFITFSDIDISSPVLDFFQPSSQRATVGSSHRRVTAPARADNQLSSSSPDCLLCTITNSFCLSILEETATLITVMRVFHGTVEIHTLELVDDFHEFTFRLADNLHCPLLFILLTASSLRTHFSEALFELDVSDDGR